MQDGRKYAQVLQVQVVPFGVRDIHRRIEFGQLGVDTRLTQPLNLISPSGSMGKLATGELSIHRMSGNSVLMGLIRGQKDRRPA